MRRVLCVLIPAMAAAGPAGASSIISLSGTTSVSPSIVTLGTAEPAPMEARARAIDTGETPPVIVAPDMFEISPSVFAYGVDAIPAAREEVASIADEEPAADEEFATDSMPLVFRGGIVGDAFSAPAAPLVSPDAPETDGPDASVETPQATQ